MQITFQNKHVVHPTPVQLQVGVHNGYLVAIAMPGYERLEQVCDLGCEPIRFIRCGQRFEGSAINAQGVIIRHFVTEMVSHPKRTQTRGDPFARRRLARSGDPVYENQLALIQSGSPLYHGSTSVSRVTNPVPCYKTGSARSVSGGA